MAQEPENIIENQPSMRERMRSPRGRLALGCVTVGLVALLGAGTIFLGDDVMNALKFNAPESTDTPTQPLLSTRTSTIEASATFNPTETSIADLVATATSQSTETPTSTVTPTSISTENLSLMSDFDCDPIGDVNEVTAHLSSGTPILNDNRDNLNALLVENLVFDSNADGIVDSAEREYLRTNVQCFLVRGEDGYMHKVFVEGDLTTIEKLLDLSNDPDGHLNLGLIDKDHLSDHTFDARLILDTRNLLGILTDGKNLSQSVVELLEQAIKLLRDGLGAGANLRSSDAVASELVAQLGLENKWNRNINPMLVDELRNCLTFRSSVESGLRLEQPESQLRVRWEAERKPGEEVYVGDTLEVSSENGILASFKMVEQSELDKILKEFAEHNRYANVVALGEGRYLVGAVFDLRHENPNQEVIKNSPDSEHVGGGGQIVPCAPDVVPTQAPTTVGIEKPALNPTATSEQPTEAVASNTPTSAPTEPNSTNVPTATKTDVPTETTVPTSTPTPTDIPTATAVSTSTFAPSQVPQATATLGSTSTLIPATPSWTPISPTAPASPMPTHTPQPSPTAVGLQYR